MKSHNKLSTQEYQRAVLSIMGVSSWQLREQAPTPQSVEEQEIISSIKGEQVGLSENLVDTPIAETLKVESVPDKVLLLMPETNANSQLVSDVLLAFNLQEDERVVTDRALAEFVDYRFSWEFSSASKIADSNMYTPVLEQLQTPALKKALWQCIQNSLPTCNDA